MPKCSARKRSRAELDSFAMSVPKTSSRPSDGVTMPHKRLKNVDFPAPEGPMSSTRSFARKAKLSIASEKARGPRQRKRTPDIETTSGVCISGRGRCIT